MTEDRNYDDTLTAPVADQLAVAARGDRGSQLVWLAFTGLAVDAGGRRSR